MLGEKLTPEQSAQTQKEQAAGTRTADREALAEGALGQDYRVLVLNSSRGFAKEITLELTLRIPGCSIMYSPSLELAKLLLQRRKVDLVVSAPLLPDGPVSRLESLLEQMQDPPDIVVVSERSRPLTWISACRYTLADCRRIGPTQVASATKPQRVPEGPSKGNACIKELGADLRNDLNNPLQEIVAMTYVARAAGSASASTLQALEAIDRAARNMSGVVNSLEAKIRAVVAA
jgi:hypothetical protein